jgi:hypothetical protein
MMTYIEGPTAIHDGTRVFGPGTPVSTHLVISKHPETGRKLIFANTDFTSRINDLSRLEGERLLSFLVDNCNKPEWTCRFRWSSPLVARRASFGLARRISSGRSCRRFSPRMRLKASRRDDRRTHRR